MGKFTEAKDWVILPFLTPPATSPASQKSTKNQRKINEKSTGKAPQGAPFMLKTKPYLASKTIESKQYFDIK